MNDIPPYRSLWRHLKSGYIYRVKCIAMIEATMTPAVVYCREDHDTGFWVRPVAEFMDGRFERVATTDAA